MNKEKDCIKGLFQRIKGSETLQAIVFFYYV